MAPSILSEEQLSRYARDGYLLIGGLIPASVAGDAEAAMWRCMGLDPARPETWQEVRPGHVVHEEPALLACYTPEYIAAAAHLAGEDPSTLRTPTRAYTINIFPQKAEWQWPRPHIDHAIKQAGHKVFPRAFRIAAMTFLSDVEPHGGGTVVWPGSHRRLESLARSDPERYELMWSLSSDIGKVDLDDPVETTPKRGDVLFYHYLCAHAGSMNVRERPRLAMNAKW